ncbi:cyclopropane-fatty-acyl-phospholipid synthase family protein [Aestuariibacter sp. AA17]|uniref:Cyclopropane-fatty-acyl-phospholipid synthase family protein n=1 Tax=Fluctibacter corallii TaxID=2984329 RepID=A0ABT3A3I5_9ALTE|nr:cyclopropane-fatty-acyl-phospholipid synthase family protein [Aestuariibacter sp. AA17]MCV2883204.1 cyclopropane-fatty-acyl-phospholipid synthase family protein [Aestuariibacter sp. AA17]
MLEREQHLAESAPISVLDGIAKKVLVKVFSLLPKGSMTLTENDRLVGDFGNRADALHAHINIIDTKAYSRLLFGGSVASGETYTDGLWDTPDLTSVIRIFARNLPMLDAWERKAKWIALPLRQLAHWQNRNSQRQAQRNIAAHYDLGNALYTRFLDETMMYSAAIYPSNDASLEQAQYHKLASICDKLQLSEKDHLLEIGTGWGGLAIYAAKHYGCKVTTTTISEEQHAYAKEWIARENLDDKITLLKQDYRTLTEYGTGKYDKIVSIEMIEAVGKAYLPTFFKTCNALLKEDGIMLLQSITIDDRRFESYSRSVDFIQKHIFPGGFLPSLYMLNNHLKHYTNMMIRDTHDIGIDYARTLQDWHRNFNASARDLLNNGYDERFMRLWRYYFCYCEGGFLERTISTVQLVLTKPACTATWVR